MINSLIYWLQKVANKEKNLTHWQIKTIFSTFEKDLEKVADEELKLLVYPLIQQLISTSSHKHKSLVANFLLNLINEHESKKKKEEFDPDIF